MIYIISYLLFSTVIFLLCCYTSLKLAGEVTCREFVIFLFFGLIPILNFIALYAVSLKFVKGFGNKR